jgi:hypothetical protein
MGLASLFSVHCDTCEEIVWSGWTSRKCRERYEINYRVVLAGKEAGVSFTKMSHMFSLMNIGQPMHHKTYDKIAKEIHTAAVAASETVMNQAAEFKIARHAPGSLVAQSVSTTGNPGSIVDKTVSTLGNPGSLVARNVGTKSNPGSLVVERVMVSATGNHGSLVTERVKVTTTGNPGSLVTKRVSATGSPIISISFDGSWHRRGRSSHNGVGVVVDVDTGLVLDTEVLSNICVACEKGPNPGSENFGAWFGRHKGTCQKNFEGSSNAMEAEAAERIFKRSIKNRGLVYGTMLCDGDCKAFVRANETAGYDVEIVKEDCINHVAKRMFNSLENLKKTNKKELDRKLTKPMIEKITNTYAKNLKAHAPDVSKMRLGVLGGIFHMSSTDKEPNHRHCPPGEDTWCGYQRALAKKVPPPKHKPTFKPNILPIIYPTIMRLIEPALLERCSKMQTQNANESFNSQIWKRCPKTEFSSRTTVETAVALAVLSFNCGPAGFKFVMDELQVSWGENDNKFAMIKTQQRVQRAKRKMVGQSKWKRKNRKLERIQENHDRVVAEGTTYESGAFNI